jgi:hypothetical protein
MEEGIEEFFRDGVREELNSIDFGFGFIIIGL